MPTKNAKIAIVIGWPDKPLWINRRAGYSHWREYPAKEAALNEGCVATLQALGGEPKPDWQGERLALTITAHKGNKGTYDLDNLAGALKHHLDGIAATLGINDKQFDRLTVIRGKPEKVGRVVIEIERIEGEER